MSIDRVPTPRHLLRQVATITPGKPANDDYAHPRVTNAGKPITVACSFQPNSPRDAVLYQRDTGTATATMYCDPMTTDGKPWGMTDIELKHSSVTVSGVSGSWRVIGTDQNAVSAGSIFVLNVERDF